MSQKFPTSTDFDQPDKNPFNDVKFLDFLQKEGNEKDYIQKVVNFVNNVGTGSQSHLDSNDQLKRIVQHSLNASGKLFTQGKHAEVLELLETTRNLLIQSKNKDPSLETMKSVLYNNISACCLSIEDTPMAIRFIQSCLKKDAGLDINLTCVFYNNLAGIYLASKEIEKAFSYTKKSLHILEPQIFSEIKEKPAKTLKEDAKFRKNLVVLLIGYMNMGHTLEAYRMISGAPREVLQMVPRDFYKNAYDLAKKFLGENHTLTQRLYFCSTKNEFILFKEVITDSSEADRNLSSRRKLKHMLDSVDDEDRMLSKKVLEQHLSNSYSPKTFQIKKNYLKLPKRSNKNCVTTATSPTESYLQTDEDPPEHAIHHAKSHNRFHSTVFLQQGYNPRYVHPRKQSGGYGWEMSAQNIRPTTPDHTQFFMQIMFNQQKDLENKLNDKFKELKSLSKFRQNNRNEIKIFDLKDDLKIKLLQKEIEALKYQVSQIKQGKEFDTTKPPVEKAESHSNFDNQLDVFQHEDPKITLITTETVQTPKKETEPAIRFPDTENSHHHLSPNKIFATNSVKSDKSSFEDNITLPNFDASPIARVIKPQEIVSGLDDNVWPAKSREETKKMSFKLDLNKVENRQFPQEKKNKEEEKKAVGNNQFQIQIKSKEPSDTRSTGSFQKTPLTFSDSKKFVFHKEFEEIVPKEEKTSTFMSPKAPEEDPSKRKGLAIPEKTELKSPKHAQVEALNKPKPKPAETEPKPAKVEEKLVRNNTNEKLKVNKKISFTIPNTIDYLELPSGGQASSGSKMIPKYAVIKKRIFLDDDVNYMLVCSAVWTSQEKSFKWQLLSSENGSETEFNKLNADLELAYKDLYQILKLIEFRDVMPTTFHIKQITSFYNLVKYFLMPFTTVKISENGKKEIAIYPKPPNLLTNSASDMPTVEFMGRQCVMIFTHVTRNIFRIVLTDPDTVGSEDAFRIDVEFDKPSFDLYFQRYCGSDPSLLTAETLVKIIQGFDDDADDDEITDFKETLKKLTNAERKDEEEIESFKVIHKDLVDELSNTLRDLESALTGYGLKNLNQLLDRKEVKYCKLKVTGSIKKTSLHLVWDRPEKRVLEIKIQNFFETFAPNAKKIKAQGTINYQYDSAWKHFGLNYTQIEYTDKIAICNMVSEIYYIDFFEKELKKDEYDRYEENPISFVPVEIGAYHRVFIGDTKKVPVTLALVGIRGEPRGIKATSYNLEEVYEGGTFFHINPMLWAKKETEKKKKKSERVATLTLIENYRLDFVMKKCGWDILKSWFIMNKRPSKADILNMNFLKEVGYTEQLENVVDVDAIVRYFKEKEDL